MIVLQRTHANSNPTDAPHKVYIEAFRCHCFELIVQGYTRLDCQSLRDKEEPDITGRLVEAIENVMQNANAPEWVTRYSIKDDPPVNVPEKHGKSRPRVDIAFEWVRRGNRPLFRIEAKWVGKEKPALGEKGGYLGKDGIGRFLSNYYPVKIGHAGMLGYVHSDGEIFWANKIQERLKEKESELRILKSDGKVWKKDKAQELSHAFISIHDCPLPVGQLHITHLLLRFC